MSKIFHGYSHWVYIYPLYSQWVNIQLLCNWCSLPLSFIQLAHSRSSRGPKLELVTHQTAAFVSWRCWRFQFKSLLNAVFEWELYSHGLYQKNTQHCSWASAWTFMDGLKGQTREKMVLLINPLISQANHILRLIVQELHWLQCKLFELFLGYRSVYPWPVKRVCMLTLTVLVKLQYFCFCQWTTKSRNREIEVGACKIRVSVLSARGHWGGVGC